MFISRLDSQYQTTFTMCITFLLSMQLQYITQCMCIYLNAYREILISIHWYKSI